MPRFNDITEPNAWVIHAVTRECVQIGPDSWETRSIVVDLDDTTTIGDLRARYREANGSCLVSRFSIELTFAPKRADDR